MLLQESLWIMTFFWILKEMIRVFRWNLICYTWYFFQLFIFFFFFLSRTLQNITWGRYRTAQSLATDIIRTPGPSAKASCFCRPQYQFQPLHHCQTLVFAPSGRTGHRLRWTSLPCPVPWSGKLHQTQNRYCCEVHLCSSQASYVYMQNMMHWQYTQIQIHI